MGELTPLREDAAGEVRRVALLVAINLDADATRSPDRSR